MPGRRFNAVLRPTIHYSDWIRKDPLVTGGIGALYRSDHGRATLKNDSSPLR